MLLRTTAAAVFWGAAVRERAMEEEWGGLGKDLANRKRGEPVGKAQSPISGLRKSACGGRAEWHAWMIDQDEESADGAEGRRLKTSRLYSRWGAPKFSSSAFVRLEAFR